MLAIIRLDMAGTYAIPGGIVAQGKGVSAKARGDLEAAARRLPEEQSERTLAQLTALFEQTNLVYRGYVDDHRNTDNAWMESTAMLFHCDAEVTRPAASTPRQPNGR